MKKILVINGPSLNLLGIREPKIYGTQTYKDLIKIIKNHCKSKCIRVKTVQSNCEGKIVKAIQKAYFKKVDGIVINPAGYTHTSVVLRDAIASVSIPTVEVHISKVEEREEFRQIDLIKDVCVGYVSGERLDGYKKAIDILLEKIGG